MTAKGAKEPPLPQDLKAQLDALTAIKKSEFGVDDVETTERLSRLRDDWKTLGNTCYGKGFFLAAIQCYSHLLELPGGDTATIRSNRSAAYLQSPLLSGPLLALKDAQKAVELEPQWFKAHLRVGDAQRRRGCIVEADAAYREALALQPDCAAAQAGLRAVEAMSSTAFSAAATSSADFLECASFSNAPESQQGLPSRTAVHATATAHLSEEAPELTQEQLIQVWKSEISTREGRTGCRPRRVSLSQADRQRGNAIKQAFMTRFRSKLESDEDLSATLRKRHEEYMLLGEGVNYREADKARRIYSHSTNAIGLGISSDAYKEHTGRVDHRTW
ncbi:hypothetical protein JKF63_00201 [Porcisia hertigi]|uniref:Uncharacterized protein n=1 Tax=Porcisia hertigi TaxID=2761500 RepID=A0A836HPK2_9TRYP|nr:hypothetical protein JKF63_00201 [Porcisia hertigi]